LVSSSAAQEYVCLAFSVDGTFLAAQGAGPEWNLAMWQWEKSKLSGVVKGATQARLARSLCPMVRFRPWTKPILLIVSRKCSNAGSEQRNHGEVLSSP
jgi:hypothetical protein